MATITTGVNTTSATFDGTNGRNRIRFEKISSRLQNLSVDILHRVPITNNTASATSDVRNQGFKRVEFGGETFFASELELIKQLETGKHFDYFYRSVSSFVQSLPELLHNLEKVVSLLIIYISRKPDTEASTILPMPSELGSYISLVVVLVR